MFYPNDRQFFLALLLAIASHRDVQNSQVYYPNTTTRVPITKLRLNGGLELVEQGLTLAVYPCHSSYDVRRGTPPSAQHVSIYYDKKSIVNTSGIATYDNQYIASCCYRAIVQLFLLNADFDENETFKYQVTDLVDRSNPYGYQIMLPEGDLDYPFLIDQTLEIVIQPGEEVLRQWMTILRGVVRDLPQIGTFVTTFPQICYVDYPTTNYLRKSENIAFHTALMLVEFEMAEPSRLSDAPSYPFIQPDINF